MLLIAFFKRLSKWALLSCFCIPVAQLFIQQTHMSMSCPRVWAGVDLAGKEAGVKSLNVGKGVPGPGLALRSHF